MKHFHPHQPDKYIKKGPDMEIAKFGHLNAIVDVLNQQAEVNTGLTAFAVGTQLGATPLIPGFNSVTIGILNSSVILPSLTALCACTPCGPIAPVVVVNDTAFNITIYPAVGEFINGLGVNVPVTLAPGESLSFKNISCNTWNTYGASGTGAAGVIESIVSCGVTLPVVEGVVTIPAIVTDATLTGTGCAGAPLHVVGVIAPSFADFFALMPGDNAATVTVGAAVQFPQDGPTSATGITALGPSTYQLATIGTYEVYFQVSVTEAGQLVLFVNAGAIASFGGSPTTGEITYTTAGRATGTDQITNKFLITTTAINTVISIHNPAGNSTALTITPIAGGTLSASAHLVIEQLA